MYSWKPNVTDRVTDRQQKIRLPRAEALRSSGKVKIIDGTPSSTPVRCRLPRHDGCVLPRD
jgi:hypothetical protein